MRVLQITAFSGWGCTGRIAQGICETLIENGKEAAIAWGRTNTAPDTIETIQIGNRNDQLLHGLYTRITDRCGLGSKAVTKKFLKQMDAYAPDIVHLHIMHGYYINIEILFRYLKEKKIPVVWTFHDCWAFTGHCPYFDMVGCEKWKTGCYSCEQKLHHPQSLLLDNSKGNYRRKREAFTGVEKMVIVTPSEWLKGLVEQSFLKEYSVKVINNGINTKDFQPTFGIMKEKLGIGEKKILLGVSSTWAEGKGLKDFVTLSQKISPEYRVVLVGLTKKQLKELPETITGVERTDSVKELAELYTAATAFLNLTYEDNYPTTNLEAIACGTPVITYRTGGSPEIVEKTGFGQVVSQGNVEEVIEAIEKVEGMTVTADAVAYLEQQERFKDYRNLYEELLSEKENKWKK